MELTEMPLSQLSENTANPRVISDAKLDKLVEPCLSPYALDDLIAQTTAIEEGGE